MKLGHCGGAATIAATAAAVVVVVAASPGTAAAVAGRHDLGAAHLHRLETTHAHSVAKLGTAGGREKTCSLYCGWKGMS